MKIKEFIAQFNNYPILFIGTGIDLRYLQQAYNWESLLKQIACDFRDVEYFKELKYTHIKDGNDCDYAALASEMSSDFDICCKENRNGKFKDINDVFYSLLDRNIKVSRLKLYVAKLLSSLSVREKKQYEIECLKNAKKNIASIITTNL